MVVIETVKGDLLLSKKPGQKWYIAQQSNCNSRKPHGLSQSIVDKWSYANPYGTRGKEPDVPGTVIFMEPSVEDSNLPIVLCLMAQWGPSKPGAYSHRYPRTYRDTKENRKEWFRTCLVALDQNIPADQIVNVPYCIGCGLAGGNWNDYKKMLQDCKTQFRIWQL